jgi:hypothetical protein
MDACAKCPYSAMCLVIGFERTILDVALSRGYTSSINPKEMSDEERMRIIDEILDARSPECPHKVM